MPKNLVDLQLLDLVLDLALGRMDFPHVDADREAVLLVHNDLSLHNQVAAEQDVEQVRARSDVVDDLVSAVLLLAEVRVHLLDELGRPRLEQRDLLQVVHPPRLLHVFNVENLVVEVSFLELKTDCDSVR